MTEQDIQMQIARWCLWEKQHRATVPNAHFYDPNEADIMSVTKAGIAHVFEIKISRSDLKADFKKERHIWLKKRQAKERHFYGGGSTWLCPNYFWFVAPEPVLAGIAVPDYAGIMITGTRHVRIARHAPRLHREKLTDAEVAFLLSKLQSRFWNERLREQAQNDGASLIASPF